MFQNDELELDVVVGVNLRAESFGGLSASTLSERTREVASHPILGRLSHKGALVSSGTRVTRHGCSTSSNEVVQPRELQDDLVVALLVEGPLLEEVAHENALQRESGAFLRGETGR